ncbi:MAG: hypothetical protein JWN72_1300 [Thermoleophilia bacterium]|nr:hypothetical protein [Thermoleophilia bacterium]
MSSDLHLASQLFSGERLRIARLASGLTLSELGRDVGKSSAALSQFEKDKSKPSPETLSRIAMSLGYDVQYFGGAAPSSSAPEATFFRSLTSTRSRDRAAVGSKAILLGDLLGAIETYVDLPPVCLDTPTSTARRSIEVVEDEARKIRASWGVDAGPVGNLTRLLEANGIVVVNGIADVEKVDACSRWLRERPLILMPTTDNTARIRFSLAHELGHIAMHDVAEAGIRAIEVEANQFAAEFLMPRLDIQKELPSRPDWAAFVRLKHRWGVSIDALLFRARTLGRMSETVYRRAVTDANRRGWTSSDPYPLPANETPVLIERCLDAMKAGGLDPDLVTRESLLPAPLVRQFVGPRRARLHLAHDVSEAEPHRASRQ